ncbi:MAG: type II toxin-antitoxin system VapB family antitoxin [Fidelibacterota bacterium]
MKTTLDISKELMEEGLRVTQSKTKTELVNLALKEIIRKNKIQKIKKYQGKIDLKIDLDNLRKRA